MRHHLFGSCLALAIAASVPTFAQAQLQDTETQRADRRADRDDRGEWGWIGLLGLVGLMGLKRRNRYDDLRQGHTTTR